MRALIAAALTLAAAAAAQIELPAYTSTYSNAGHTRGFYFQTPVPLMIVGLRVPDEKNHGTQHVEVFKLTQPPPIYSATGSGGQVFFRINQPSKDIIPCSLLFAPGEYVCVLGGCGDATLMHSSYGAGGFVSSVHGQPITLYRFLTQNNIAVSGGNNLYSGFNTTSSIGRVEVYVAGHTSAMEFGAATPVGGAPAPSLRSSRPTLGATAVLRIEQQNSVNQGAVLVLGTMRASIPVFGGTLLVLPPYFLTVAVGGPLATGSTNLLSLPIPNDPYLLGTPLLDFQAFLLVIPDLAMTNGLEWKLGR